MLLQHPTPPHIDYDAALAEIDPDKDADGAHPVNMGRLALGMAGPRPCTPAGIVALLRHYEIPVAGRNVAVLGRGFTLGRPLSILLSLKEEGANAAVTLLHTGVPDWADYTRAAPIVIAAAGVPGILQPEHISPGAVVVGGGVRYEGRKLLPDVDERCEEVAGWITPAHRRRRTDDDRHALPQHRRGRRTPRRDLRRPWRPTCATRSPRRWARRWPPARLCTAATWPARTGSSWPAVASSSRRPTPRRRPASSPPRRPACRWLREAGQVAVPEVVAVSDEDPTFLVLEWIDEGRLATTTDASLGTGLAALHRAGAPSFGREDRRSTGSRGLPNEPCATWSEFYATNRLLPLARLARDAGAIPGAAIEAMEAAGRPARRRRRRGRAAGPAARRPVVRQPARRLGRRQLADRPGRTRRPPRVRPRDDAPVRWLRRRLLRGLRGGLAARDGWAARIPLHQIAPLVVHAIKFGGAYVAAAERAIERAGRLV